MPYSPSKEADFSQVTRARATKHVPVVLSRLECQRLFAVLEGTTRLMAELLYGSGLRLTELLHLRVQGCEHDTDLHPCHAEAGAWGWMDKEIMMNYE